MLNQNKQSDLDILHTFLLFSGGMGMTPRFVDSMLMDPSLVVSMAVHASCHTIVRLLIVNRHQLMSQCLMTLVNTTYLRTK